MSTSSYTELATAGLVDLTGKTAGSAVVVGTGTLALCATVIAMPVAAAAVAAATKIANSVQETPADISEATLAAAQSTVKAGFNAFETVRPMLFSAGYAVGSNATSATLYASYVALSYFFQGLVKMAEAAQYAYEHAPSVADISLPEMPVPTFVKNLI